MAKWAIPRLEQEAGARDGAQPVLPRPSALLPAALVPTLRRLSGHWRQRRGETFARAYAASFSHRLPLLFLVACCGLAALALRFAGTAPWPLLMMAPVLAVYAVARGWHWLPQNVARRPLEEIQYDIQRMGRLGGLVALVFVSWALSLYGYGDVAQKALVHYILAVTTFSAILGLAHAPGTALRMAAAFTLPAALFFLTHGHPNALYVALVQSFVTAILLVVTHGHHRDFVRLELSRQQLARRERHTARLAQANFEQASADSLTGVMNRRAILARLEQEMAHQGQAPPWLALVDLDGFKHVNDTYGHAAGDDVLRAVAERIGKGCGVIAHGRLGGDEFAILFDGALDGKAVAGAAHRLAAAIREPIRHNGVTLRLYASIGIHRVRAAGSAGGGGVNGGLERADAALYKAKARGEGAIVLFGPDDEIALQQRIVMTRQFNDCTLDGRLRLLYQPLFDVEAGRPVGFEAFARWSPDGVNWLAPGAFMAMAEATRRTGELTSAVLKRALVECDVWQQGLTLSINLAERDVMRDGAVDALAAIVRDAGASPEAIVLEVTERALLADPRRAAAQLQTFRDHGFRIALDDFGAGWSSLSQLRDLPLDVIKIDQALARALATDPGARAVAGAIVALAWQMGFDCTIEGIEDEVQVATARALGIRLMQGYHFGRPEPAPVALAAIDRAVA